MAARLKSLLLLRACDLQRIHPWHRPIIRWGEHGRQSLVTAMASDALNVLLPDHQTTTAPHCSFSTATGPGKRFRSRNGRRTENANRPPPSGVVPKERESRNPINLAATSWWWCMMPGSEERGVIVESIFPFFWKIGAVLFGLVSFAAGLLYVKQESLLYFPEIAGLPRRPSQNPRRLRSPKEHNLPFEEHRIRCKDDVNIHSWLLLQSDAKKRATLIFFHGNAGNIGMRLPNAGNMYHHLKANILMVEYRGYGDSDDAKPTEAGLKLDSEAALRFILEHPQVDRDRVFVFGRSLGGAVGFHLANYAEKNGMPLAGLIVENTFLSISHMVDEVMPFLTPIKAFVLRIGWNSYKIAPQLKLPVLYLAGDSDELVPHSHMRQLYQASRKSSDCARMHVVRGGNHNETWLRGGKQYWEQFRSFLSEVMSGEISRRSSSTSLVDDVGAVSKTAVNMGGDTASSPLAGGSIPTMPKNFMGIAREAASQTSDKKDK